MGCGVQLLGCSRTLVPGAELGPACRVRAKSLLVYFPPAGGDVHQGQASGYFFSPGQPDLGALRCPVAVAPGAWLSPGVWPGLRESWGGKERPKGCLSGIPRGCCAWALPLQPSRSLGVGRAGLRAFPPGKLLCRLPACGCSAWEPSCCPQSLPCGLHPCPRTAMPQPACSERRCGERGGGRAPGSNG